MAGNTASAIIDCGLRDRLGLMDKYSCKVKWTSRTVEEDSSIVMSPKEQLKIV